MTREKDFIDSRVLLLIFLLACQVILTIAIRLWLREVFDFTNVMRAGEPYPFHYRTAQALYRFTSLAYIQPLLTFGFLVAVLKKPGLKRYVTTFCAIMGVTFIAFYAYLIYGASDGLINDRLRGMSRGMDSHRERIEKVEKSEQDGPSSTAAADKNATLPIFGGEITSQILAVSANSLMDMGEEQAVAYLKEYASRETKPLSRRPSEISWMCKLVFEPKKKELLRPPGYGALFLPYETMPLERWPHFPLVVVDGVIFVLADGYILGGVAETPEAYLEYCLSNGVFRKKKFEVPTDVEASRALDALFASPRWKAIKWSHSEPNRSYSFSEESQKEYLRAQTR